MMRRALLRLVLCCAFAGTALPGAAEVDRLAPDFVRASLLVSGPCETLYGCVGHAAIRLTCPHYALDEVFSFEGEPVRHQELRFLAGRLKMALLTSSFADYLEECREEGRGLREYALALSPAAKVRLWQRLDARAAEGANRPYDYVRHGCAQSVLRELLGAIAPGAVAVKTPFRHAGETRRDILQSTLSEVPWTRLLIHLISGPSADRMEDEADVVIMPEDLVDALGRIEADGNRLVSADPVELLPQRVELKGVGSVLSPVVCAVLLFVLAVAWCIRPMRPMTVLLVTVQASLAAFVTYTGLLSNLPSAFGNVLLVPFNPLPFVFWRWRRHWGRPFAGVLVLWSLVMLLAPHHLTDPSMVVLALAYVPIYWKRG